jgi:hypothetical protein
VNYELMLERCIAGLNIIMSHEGGSKQVCAHSYVVAVPDVNRDDYRTGVHKAEDEELQELGWAWDDDMGWVFPVIG